MKSSARRQAHVEVRLLYASAILSTWYGTGRQRAASAPACCKAPRHAAWAIRAPEFAAALKLECLARNVKGLCHSTREHNDFRAVFKEFLDVGNLNAGIVTNSTFAPVPFTRTTGEKFCVFVRLGCPLDLRAVPTKHD